jgi:SPP1 family predicted phage head-tail adaptor
MKKMIASRLRQKLTLQKEIQTSDTAGGYTRTWEDVADVWAEIEPIAAREKFIAMQMESEITHRMHLRARTGVDASQRLSGDGRVFYIRSVTPIERNSLLELLVEERAGV